MAEVIEATVRDTNNQIVSERGYKLAAQPKVVADYRGGKKAATGFLVGQVMKATAGKANPSRVNELLKRALGS